ncbi:MAG: hypothetical protein CL811_08455 [Colwelliaceae bacterium]|nr:hypothetical protein [Colwelliaceae bacterium]|tara:strand:- start:271 stop:807 length:537 start_codon:yes stop_codon:yes gene_type:complete
MKPLLVKASLLLALMSAGTKLVEAKPLETTSKLHGLKIAIVKDAVGSTDIVAGDYTTGLSKIDELTPKQESGYDIAMGKCVANIKLNELASANMACSQAIESIDEINGHSRHIEFLKSMALSNRAIVRYLSNDSLGALDDFTSALLVNDNDIVKSNILALKQIRADQDEKLVASSFSE